MTMNMLWIVVIAGAVSALTTPLPPKMSVHSGGWNLNGGLHDVPALLMLDPVNEMVGHVAWVSYLDWLVHVQMC